MQTEFDLPKGLIRKEVGIERASSIREEALEYAKAIAYEIAMGRVSRECTIDDVQRVLMPENIKLGMAAGAVFRDKGVWEFTGRYAKSPRVSNHARHNKIWRVRR
jgi:hypothetical protein